MSGETQNWKRWPEFIQRRAALRKAKFGDPSGVPGVLANDESVDASQVVDWIYSVLTTLDAKASALMRLNGVLIAAAAFLLGLFHRQGGSILSLARFDAVLIILCALLSAISISICLFVVNVSWSFLGKVTTTEATFEFATEIESLSKACLFRQRAYRWAWGISLAASMGFLVEFLWQTVFVMCFSA